MGEWGTINAFPSTKEVVWYARNNEVMELIEAGEFEGDDEQ